MTESDKLRQERDQWENEALRLREQLAEARKILFAYGEENEGTAHPWWGVIKKNRMGAQAICAGPFFSRGRAETHADARTYEYGATVVWCFSGHRSQDYVALRKALEVAE